MKRNNLTTALLAGLAGAAGLATTAQAVNLNPDGLGQVLIYPYFTVNAGNQTLVSVVNTTNRVKAVKVRFLEGRNSKEVLDFNLYMSPFDTWATSVFDDGAVGTGPGSIATGDTSCTVPVVRNVIVPFRNYQYTGTNQDFPSANPSGPSPALLGSLERTREGHVEMIEMGLLQNGTGAAQLAEEATHVPNAQVAGQLPLNCTALLNAWLPTNGVWGSVTSGVPSTNIDTPTGGLFGAGALVDTADGTMLAYNADAIEGFYTNSAAPGALHTAPGFTTPSLTAANNGGTVTSFIFSNNGAAVISETFPTGLSTPDPVSLVYMHNNIYNEYNTEPNLGASSEWVITFPTKRFYVDVASDALVVDPFQEAFRDDGQSCHQVDIAYFNREEQSSTALGFCALNPFDPACAIDFSPPPPGLPPGTPVFPVLCEEANILAFNQSGVAAGGASRVLGATYAKNVNLRVSSNDPANAALYTSGWLRMGFDDPATVGVQDHILTTPDSSQYFGLPTTGFWAINVINSAAQPGLLANYSGAFRHKGSRANSG